MDPLSLSGLPQTELQLAFVGTWPSPLSNVETTVTQWRVTDYQGTVWLMQTFNAFGESPAKYRVARPITRTTRDGYQWSYTYDATGHVSAITDSFGRAITFTWRTLDPAIMFGTTGYAALPVVITGIALPDGTSLSYQYESLEPSCNGTTPCNLIDTIQILDRVDHLDATSAVLASTQYHHENTDWPTYVTGITDARGVRAWNFAYDSKGRATSSGKAGGVDQYTVSYSALGVTPPTRTTTNALGRQTVYKYNNLTTARLSEIDGVASANCLGDVSSLSYSSAGFISSKTDQEGRVTNYTRDARGRPTQITEAAGTADQRVTTMTWHSTLDLPLTISRPGLTTTNTYDSNGRLTSRTLTDTTTQTIPYSTNGQTRVWTYTYTSQGLLHTVDGPLAGSGDTTTYTYDSNGYLSQVTDALGHVRQISSVNGRGQPTEVVDANGVITDLDYDDLGHLTTITRNPGASEAVTEVEYNEVGDVTQVTRPDGSYLQYTYDDARRLTTIANDAGEEIDYSYNAASEVTSVDTKSASGTIVLTRDALYDELGRLMQSLGADLQQTDYDYDKVDNLTALTDPLSNLYTYGYDRLNRLHSIVEPTLGQTNLTYDVRDNMTALQDATSLTTTFVRNGFGDVIRQTSPDTGITDYTVDALGHLTSKTDARGVTVNYTYDALGRVLTKTFPASSGENVAYTYDDTTGGNFGVGRLTSFSDGSGSTAYAYDDRGNIVGVQTTIGSNTYTTAYAYDAADHIIGMTYPSGRIVTYTRGSGGRVSSITTQDDALATPVLVADDISYLPFSPAELFDQGGELASPHLDGLLGLAFGNGLALSVFYDQDGQLTGMETSGSGTQVQDLTLGYDAGSNLTSITDNLDSARTQTFTYDALGRLATASGIYGDITYSYDLIGDRTGRVIENGTTTTETYSYTAGTHHLASIAIGATSRNFSYTAVGSVSGDDRYSTGFTFSYNNAGRLSQVSAGSGIVATYSYDPLEHRVARSVGGTTTHFVYDRSGHLLTEGDAIGGLVKDYIWIGDTPVAVVDYGGATATTYYVHSDHLGRPQKITDVTATVMWDGQFQPFGEIQNIGGSITTQLLFPGQYHDPETALSQNWHREYDVSTGRYLQADPRGLDGRDRNLYRYAADAPLNRTDPSGTEIYPYGGWPVPPPDGPGAGPQDWVCSSIAAPLNSFQCTKDCCSQHDTCFAVHGCTQESLIGNEDQGQRCAKCNLTVELCVASCVAKACMIPARETMPELAPLILTW